MSERKLHDTTCLAVGFCLLITQMGLELRPACEFTPGGASIADECEEAGPHTPHGRRGMVQFQFTPAATVNGTVTLSDGTLS